MMQTAKPIAREQIQRSVANKTTADAVKHTLGASEGLPAFLQREAEANLQRNDEGQSGSERAALFRQPQEEEETLQTESDENALQRQPVEEEEELQAKAAESLLQRQPVAEDEELQTRRDSNSHQSVSLESADQPGKHVSSHKMQAKLTVSHPNDPYEQEADRVADEVMRMPEPVVQRQESEEDNEVLQSKPLATKLARQPLDDDEEEEEEVQAQLEANPLSRQADDNEDDEEEEEAQEIQPKQSDGTLFRQAEDEEDEEEEQPVQAKSIADRITPFRRSGMQRQPMEEEQEPIQAKSTSMQRPPVPRQVSQHVRSLAGRGQPLPNHTRSFFENRFAQNFGHVRIHTDSESLQSARAIQAKAFTLGNNIVFGAGHYAPESGEGKRLLAHELTHVVQQTGKRSRTLSPGIQRQVMMADPAASTPTYTIWRTMPQRQRRQFVMRRFNRAERSMALRVIEDMGAAGDSFRFDNEDQLFSDIRRRVLTSRFMRMSQRTTRRGWRGFGYPFTSPSLFWGPRVNYAARDYWVPATPDNYSLRRDPVKRRQLRRLPRHQRYSVFGDQGPHYRFSLNSQGQADPYAAIINLFPPQPVHKRSLIHCDYLVSLVHFRAFAETLGRAEFNHRAIAFLNGGHNIVLRYNLFSDLEVPLGMSTSANPLGSLQRTRPSSEADFVIGDHVVYFNHIAYDLINRRIGNAWRLENAVLIDRRNGQNIFLGHGSGQKTSAQLKSKLAQEYNDVVNIALGIIRRTGRGSAAARAAAQTEMNTRFPNIRKVSGEWRVIGWLSLFGLASGASRPYYNQPLRIIRANEVVGPKDPTNLSRMYFVRRPVESRG